ncbi:molybdopterin synthase sulfur carrier subunit-like [Oppia nitens]|uniref:molybdopterin synthase sulfur carrier subunit-like n=1 Tax=Oppia nitens TaxID=1686743 RepID=UPI0023DC0F23|nr:molybdopterin synthase sulfur carrier subunit-like [Oppia nitens]
MTVEISVLLFAMARDRVGTDRVAVPLVTRHWPSRQLLLDYLFQTSPELQVLTELRPILAVAINEQYVTDDDTDIVLEDNDVVALIPPITGG